MDKIKIAVLGYGNLGRGVECAVKQNPDMELAGIYTRRDPKTIKPLTEGVKVCHVSELEQPQDIDVLILCSGSATELPYYGLYDAAEDTGFIGETIVEDA